MDKLIDGFRRFARDVYPTKRELFGKLAGGQAPSTLFITCSDSRIDPSLITQTEPGDLFVIRNAGNFIPAYGSEWGEAATVEYAVAVVGVTDVVVCGHSQCGAINALLTPGSTDKLPAVARWLEYAEAPAEGGETGEDRVPAAIQANVRHQLDNLRTHPSVADALQKGSLRLHGWVYDIGEGALFVLDPESDRFQKLDV